MRALQLNGSLLSCPTPGGLVTLDLRTALRARMFNRPETRFYTVSEFEVRGVYPAGDVLKVHLVNAKEGLFIPLILRATRDGLRATVPAGQIVEQFGINRKIMDLAIFPELMQTRVGDNGFYLIPCWSGTLVRFKPHAPFVNRDRIYMDQEEWEKLNLLNCFAVNHAGKGILGIVHKGDFNCQVVSEMNQSGINRLYASFILRTKEAGVIKQEDKEVVYAFSQGRDAEYPGMAIRYREYLVDERGVSPLKERIADNPVLKYAISALRTKLFMGCKRPSLPDGSGEFVPMVTCEEAEKIIDAMKQAGIRNANITLVGWNLGGHDGAYPTRFPIEPGIGGEAGLRKLIAKALAEGYQIVPHDNFTDIYRSAPDYDPEYVARTEDGLPRVVGIWSGGQSFKACPVVYMERWGYHITRLQGLGFQGSFCCDAQSCVLWTCHDPKHPADEEQFSISLAKMMEVPRALYGAVCSEIASSFSLPFVDEVTGLHMPGPNEWLVKAQKPEFQAMIERVVPFSHIAIHGLITYQHGWVRGHRNNGSVRKGQLKELALGAKPCMEVTYTGAAQDLYTDSIRDIAWGYETCLEKYGRLYAEVMTDFEELSLEAVRVTYSDGTVLSVNWGDVPVAGLEPQSYREG